MLAEHSLPAKLIVAWRRRSFDVLTCDLQLQELRAVTRRPKVRGLIRPALAGELVNQLQTSVFWVGNLPTVDRSPDPFDNFLLALAQAGDADVLVSGDKRGLLALKTHGKCRIVTARQFLTGLGQI